MNQYDSGTGLLAGLGHKHNNAEWDYIIEDMEARQRKMMERTLAQARFREENPEWANAPKEWLDELIP